MMITTVLHGQILRNITKLPQEWWRVSFYKSLYNVLMVTHHKNIIIILLALLPTYFSDLKRLSSVELEYLKHFRYLSCLYDTEEFWNVLILQF